MDDLDPDAPINCGECVAGDLNKVPANDPTKHWRNISLRERYLHAELVFNLIFTFTCGFFIWWIGMSLDGENPPDGTEIIFGRRWTD